MWTKTLTITVAVFLIICAGVCGFCVGRAEGQSSERKAAQQLVTVVTNYGAQHATRTQGDLNGDGTVNALDLSLALSALN